MAPLPLDDDEDDDAAASTAAATVDVADAWVLVPKVLVLLLRPPLDDDLLVDASNAPCGGGAKLRA
jgi:hypothetical protein